MPRRDQWKKNSVGRNKNSVGRDEGRCSGWQFGGGEVGGWLQNTILPRKSCNKSICCDYQGEDEAFFPNSLYACEDAKSILQFSCARIGFLKLWLILPRFFTEY
jgi:hypothetical protein